MGETELVTTTTSQKANIDLINLTDLFRYSIGAFTPLELHYQDSLLTFLKQNLEGYKLEGEPVVHANLDSNKLITQAQLNRIWGRLNMKVFLAREYADTKDILDMWIKDNELHLIGEIEVNQNVAKFILEIPLVYIK